MRNLFFLFLIQTFVCSIFASGSQEDKLVGLNESELIRILGENFTASKKMINSDYLGYEFEPDYSQYFSEEELENGIETKMLIWKRKRKKIIVWLKFVHGDWISFSSLFYHSDWVNF